MWCLDKITKIDDNGIGWVLGGKPVRLKDLKEELGNSVIQISRNLNRLLKCNYLILRHTPYGIVIGVKKAKKRFNKNDKPTLSQMINPPIINDKPNKTVTVDNTVRQKNEPNFSYKKRKRIYRGMEVVRWQKQDWCIPKGGGKWIKYNILKKQNL